MNAIDRAAIRGIAAFAAVLADKANDGEALTLDAVNDSAEHMIKILGGDGKGELMRAGLELMRAGLELQKRRGP